jgi:hypothetical protein
VARASVRLRAEALVASVATLPERLSDPGACVSTTIREREFAACHGKLVGRPDVVRDGEILDYKTGEIYERGENETSATLKPSYVRQLHLYGFLVSSALGVPIRRGVLLPMTGERVEVELDQSACAMEAEVAVELLDQYNKLIGAGASSKELASPSPENCRWCPFQIICPALWAKLNDSWFGTLESELLQGTLAEDSKQLMTGQAFSLAVLVQIGTIKPGRIELFPFNADMHQGVSRLQLGQLLRITGLGRRQDGNVFPSIRTVLLREIDIPRISTISKSDERECGSEKNPETYGRN